MSSRGRSRLVRTFGARIAAWYFVLFVLGALIIVVGADLLLSASLARRDRDSLLATLIRYTDAYRQGGAQVLDNVIAADRAAASYEPVFVRVIAGGRTRILSMPVEWSRFDLRALDTPSAGRSLLQQIEAPDGTTLEVASALLGDGTLFEVGRTAARRAALLERYRETMVLLFALVVVAGLAGGVTLTWRALLPLRDLTHTLTRILQTGRTSERVSVRETGDPLDNLGVLLNRMLERIDGLVTGMRSTVDTVAHDLRTPMTRLRGTAEMALQAGTSAEDYRNALADCVEEADRVSALLDALMDLAEAETGAMRLSRAPVDLAATVHDAIELYAEVAEHKQVRLVMNTAGAATVIADRVRLRQVFANLVDNAVKYTPAGGEIQVNVRVGTGGGVEVAITDTGPGIGEAEQRRIWERLYRGDQSRSARGLGIGLSLVRAIVHAHGGRVAVESEIGRGATFTVWLPAEMTQM